VAGVRANWSHLTTRLTERWDRRVDGSLLEASRERTRASVASMTARLQRETAIELPCSAEGAWSLLFESGDGSPLHEPDEHRVSLPGPDEDQVGHRQAFLNDGSSAGLVWRIVEREPGAVLRVECESTPGAWIAYRFEPLAADRCRLTIAEGFGVPEGSHGVWEQALAEAQHVRLGKIFTAVTGSTPPTPFAEALAFAEAFPASRRPRPVAGDGPLVLVRVAESVDVRATASQVWELLRDLTRVGLPDVHDDGRYAPAGPGGNDAEETWVGVRQSALGTPLGVAVSVSDEVPGRRFVARALGGRAATTTVEVVPTTRGCSVTVHRESAFHENDVDVLRRRWQLAVSRYARHVEVAAAALT